ncbi:class I SAM-dependent methyltransferase [Microlunatus soli]|uniref:Methyltransferase domain-containing protein n=1 Tax=Microlunatus soli TaxID=630515 RepID=A0A1H1UBZ7_9ACTN|nr:class I SAM-dependent methyltransferase [Microlunatus soli]SDS69933.1 Methyltransferase domain-containing protein [Microlunatus soli]
MTSESEMSTSFGAVAATYDAARPGYPAKAVAWLLQPVAADHPTVADVGAGTGKLTRAVLATGARVQAIDPDPAMLAQLAATLPQVSTAVGTAEQIPLADGAVDAVVLGQAWHWVDPVAGSHECARVLRPGGVLGLVWNVRDESVAWLRRLSTIMHSSRSEQLISAGGPEVAAPFADLERAEFEWQTTITRQGVLDLARSRSYVITASPQRREEIESGLVALCDDLGLTGDRTVELPYRTYAYRARRPS